MSPTGQRSTIVIACEQCRQPMVERTNGRTGASFLGCSGYPDCTHTQKLPASLEMERAGAMRLPGMQ